MEIIYVSKLTDGILCICENALIRGVKAVNTGQAFERVLDDYLFSVIGKFNELATQTGQMLPEPAFPVNQVDLVTRQFCNSEWGYPDYIIGIADEILTEIMDSTL